MIHLFHKGMLGNDVEAFRELFVASGKRLMAGLAAEQEAEAPTHERTARASPLAQELNS
ncbi:hypothetical protein D3C83_314430 [compost metagenome]